MHRTGRPHCEIHGAFRSYCSPFRCERSLGPMVEVHQAVSKETSVPVPPHTSRTSRTSRSLIAPAFVAVAALTLAACSSSEPEVEKMPLADVYTALDAMAGQSMEETRAHYAAQNVERENLISRCMADLGFDYAPNPSSMVGQYFGFDHGSGEQQGTVAYAKTYGLTWLTGLRRSAAQAAGQWPALQSVGVR